MINNNNNYEIPSYEENCIIQYWLRGYTRDEIAQLFDKSKGTVSNIWAKYRNKIGHYEADALRELGKELRRQNMTAENCAIGFRVFNIMKKLGIQEEKIEEFLTTVFELSQKIGIFPEFLKEALIEIVKISQTMPISDIPFHLQKMREEIEETENKKKLEEEIIIPNYSIPYYYSSIEFPNSLFLLLLYPLIKLLAKANIIPLSKMDGDGITCSHNIYYDICIKV
jgi:hypothetical protein